MPRKISPHAELPVHQVFKQTRGDKQPELLIELYDYRDVRCYLASKKKEEQTRGRQTTQNGNDGFFAHVGDPNLNGVRSVYWAETIMPDEVINSENPPIYAEILDSLAYAMGRGGVTGRAMREAAAAGINFEPGDAE